MVFHFLYRTICLTTGKFYLGIHTTDDLEDGYLGSGKWLLRSVRKYGREAHEVERLAFFETREELLAAEKAAVVVDEKDSMNLVEGGGDPPHSYGEDHHNWGGGEKISAETREKMRLAKLGKPGYATGPHTMTPEGAARIGEAASRTHKGTTRSPETRARMSLAQLGNTKNLGKKHSDETRARMRLAWIARKERTASRRIPCRINLIRESRG